MINSEMADVVCGRTDWANLAQWANLAKWAIVCFGQFYKDYRSSPNFWAIYSYVHIDYVCIINGWDTFFQKLI
jgi:hypothetical protein